MLYLAVRTRDDAVVLRPGKPCWLQDGIEIRLDGRVDSIRAVNGGAADNVAHLMIGLTPPRDTVAAALFPPKGLPRGTLAAAASTDTGMTFEVAIPLACAVQLQGHEWTGVRLNVVVNDLDTPEGRVGKLR